MTYPTLCRPMEDRGGETFVAQLQTALNADLGCDLAVDGWFGVETERQVLIFQGERDLEVDGIVGAETWKALGIVDFEPAEGYEDWRGEMRRLLMRYQTLMWLGSPIFLAVQMWGVSRDNPPEGTGWIFPAIVAAVFIPIWVMFGRLFRAFRVVFAGEEETEKRQRLARMAERELTIRKAERLRNARLRLERIQESKRDERMRELATDVERIRQSLDTEGDGHADPQATDE